MEQIKQDTQKSGRGGSRAGAGRPTLQNNDDRAVTKSITLTIKEWKLLQAHSKSRSYSKAVGAALNLALDGKDWSGDWK